MSKPTTIREVATYAGVSTATASRALNNPDYPMSAQVRQRVQEAAQRLGYAPNLMARSLRQERVRDVGLVLPNLSNPFYMQMMMGINDVLTKNDYSMILYDTRRSQEQERSCLRKLYERQVKGVMLSSSEQSADSVQEFTQRGMKFVLLDQQLAGSQNPGIHFDSRAGTKIAVSYLISLGHQRIAFATMPLIRWTRMEMYQGYREALISANIPCQEELLYETQMYEENVDTDHELRAGMEIARKFIADGCPATAIQCVNDMVAIGVIRQLQESGIQVPGDVSVIGFDDIPIAEAVAPALTTIRYPAFDAGRLAALMLMDMLNNTESTMAISMNLAPQLIIRDTVKPLGDGGLRQAQQ